PGGGGGGGGGREDECALTFRAPTPPLPRKRGREKRRAGKDCDAHPLCFTRMYHSTRRRTWRSV
ncbi:MAG: hypothetical protein RLZZ187_2753, partial [Pseudomonadota bacterium]